MTVVEEVRAAVEKLRRNGDPEPYSAAFWGSMINLLEHIADDMDDQRAYERRLDHESGAATVPVWCGDYGYIRWDWTAALALARSVLAGGGQ